MLEKLLVNRITSFVMYMFSLLFISAIIYISYLLCERSEEYTCIQQIGLLILFTIELFLAILAFIVAVCIKDNWKCRMELESEKEEKQKPLSFNEFADICSIGPVDGLVWMRTTPNGTTVGVDQNGNPMSDKECTKYMMDQLKPRR